MGRGQPERPRLQSGASIAVPPTDLEDGSDGAPGGVRLDDGADVPEHVGVHVATRAKSDRSDPVYYVFDNRNRT